MVDTLVVLGIVALAAWYVTRRFVRSRKGGGCGCSGGCEGCGSAGTSAGTGCCGPDRPAGSPPS